MSVNGPRDLIRGKGLSNWGMASTLALLVMAQGGAAAPAHAANAADMDLMNRLKQLEQMLQAQEKRISSQEQRLAQQERTIAEQQKLLSQQRRTTEAQRQEPQAAPTQPPAAQRQPQPTAQAPQAPVTTAAQAPATATQPRRNEPPVVEQIANIGGVLLPKGGLVLEPGIEYVHTTARRVEIAGFSVLPAVVIGNFEVNKTSRNTVIGSLTSRYGLTDRLEIEGKVPYIYRSDTVTARPFGVGAQQDVSTSATGHDIGDVEVAAHYQINQGLNDWPYFVGNMRLRAPTGTHPYEVPRDPTTGLERTLPTGTGTWGIEPSVTMIVPSDPLVLYSNLSYLYNVERDFGGTIGRIDPGDAIGLSFGTALAVNERSSFSIGGDFQFVRPTRQNGHDVPGSENLYIGRGILGFTQRLTDSTSLNFNFAFGVTEDAPSVQLGVRMPFTLY